MAVTSSKTAPKYTASGQRDDEGDPGMVYKKPFLRAGVREKRITQPGRMSRTGLAHVRINAKGLRVDKNYEG